MNIFHYPQTNNIRGIPLLPVYLCQAGIHHTSFHCYPEKQVGMIEGDQAANPVYYGFAEFFGISYFAAVKQKVIFFVQQLILSNCY